MTKLGYTLLLLAFCWRPLLADPSDSVFFTTGFHLGELTETSVILWTRLCAQPKPVPIRHERKQPPFRAPINFDDNMPLSEMDGAVAGAFGQVRIILSVNGKNLESPWEYVSAYRDFTLKRRLLDLQPNTQYGIRLEGRKGEGMPVTSINGSFRTKPAASEVVPVQFTASTCQYFWDFDDPVRGFKIYDSMLKLQPDFFCQTGDYVYYDKPGPMAKNVAQARHKWSAINAWPSLVEFFAQVPLYIQKDDHDLLKDDAYPGISPWGELTFADGLNIWEEQVPLMDKPYRTFRWGKDLQIWLVEVREYRSPNTDEDGPEKTIWGQEQKDWFQETLQASDATFKVLVSPIPVVGPDRDKGKNDNHSNEAFHYEGDWLRKVLSGQTNTFVINGDRHWQYVSRSPQTGLWEFSQGAASDAHAQGWSPDDVRPEHEFLRVKGGFLEVKVYRENDMPRITFIHYDVDGNEVHRKEFSTGK